MCKQYSMRYNILNRKKKIMSEDFNILKITFIRIFSQEFTTQFALWYVIYT